MGGKDKMDIAKIVIKLIAGGLVDLFAGAIISDVLDNSDVGKLPRVGAAIGGGLVAVMVGDKVGDYLCDELDDILEDVDDLKEALNDD